MKGIMVRFGVMNGREPVREAMSESFMETWLVDEEGCKCV